MPLASWLLIAGLVLSSLILGGGTRSGQWSDAIVQLLALFMLLVALFTMTVPRRLIVPLTIVGATVALPLLQLVPLPPAIWVLLPSRDLMAETLEKAAVDLQWMPLSLDPSATWQATLSLLPAIAVFLATVQLNDRSRRSLTVLIIVMVIFSVMLGLAQLMHGPGTQLRLFPYANIGDSVGFFANRNHYAALLYAAIPLLAAWIIGLFHDERPERLLGLVSGVVIFAAIVLGLAMARSRAGVLLAGLATLGSLVLAYRHGGRFARGSLVALTVAALVGVLLAVHFAFFAVAARFNDGVLDDFRLTIAAVTLSAAAAFQPIGSGIGSFVPVYQMFEPTEAILSSYINHAHNDWLELYLEAGWPAIAILLLFLAWFSAAAAKVWLSPPRRSNALDRALACAASLTVFLLLLHSAVDYPLRTTAIATLFALSCALLVEPVPRREASESGRPIFDLRRLVTWRRKSRGAAWGGRRNG